MHLLNLSAEDALGSSFLSIVVPIDHAAFRAFRISWIQKQHPEIVRNIDIFK
jgi:sugar (pentulose or hexulose) kinase